MYYDAQTYEQEQGVSILYLAIGFLKWYESDASDKARYAPLLLVPVDLERPSAASRFHLRYREEDVTTNLSLQAKLKREFGIELPDIPEMEEILPESYFNAVAQAVDGQSRWEVLRDDMVLWFFSFAKYLMYRDLDPANWPAHSPLGSNSTLSSLLGDGFVAEPALCGDGDKIDPLIPPANDGACHRRGQLASGRDRGSPARTTPRRSGPSRYGEVANDREPDRHGRFNGQEGPLRGRENGRAGGRSRPPRTARSGRHLPRTAQPQGEQEGGA